MVWGSHLTELNPDKFHVAELFITIDDSINFNESVKQSTFFIVSSSKAAAHGQEERRVKMGGPELRDMTNMTVAHGDK